ncbi:hypothetical protein GCT13_02275 [Paraburkholderia sp. CNPSo 3157]|uniref:Uncharacterized protein n=1 Tax=Paraburkholderia franconis TaxID=2654983 RepID=A0A7X1N5M6_9BURK|nr:hypothetical protein [Paraburkholderia franconis]
MAMLADLSARPAAPDTTLFFCARSQRDLYCHDDLERLRRAWPGTGRLLRLPVPMLIYFGAGTAAAMMYGFKGIVTFLRHAGLSLQFMVARLRCWASVARRCGKGADVAGLSACLSGRTLNR